MLEQQIEDELIRDKAMEVLKFLKIGNLGSEEQGESKKLNP